MLEDEAHFSSELLPALDERSRDGKEDCRVCVVSAGMHHAGPSGTQLEAALLGYREGVDIGA